MKILYIVNNIDSKNGWGRYSGDLISGIRKKGNDVVIIKEKDDGKEIRSSINKIFFLVFSILKIIRLARDYEIIHSIDGYPNAFIGAIASFLTGKKFIVTIIGTFSIEPLFSKKYSLLLKWSYKRADAITSISNFSKNEVLKIIPNLKIEVINPGISKTNILSAGKASPPFIISVGALKRRKGYQISIPAFAEAKKNIPDLRYVIVCDGNPDKIDYYRRIAINNGVGKDVDFISNITDTELESLYQSAQIFILTSVNIGHQFEGFGLVFLEAAAAGLPVIGTSGNGIEDAIKKNYNGFIVPQNDIRATSDAISSIMNDKNLYRSMSEAGRRWAEQNSLSIEIDKFLELYKKVILNN